MNIKNDVFEFDLPKYASVGIGNGKVAMHIGNGKFVCATDIVLFEIIAPEQEIMNISPDLVVERMPHPFSSVADFKRLLVLNPKAGRAPDDKLDSSPMIEAQTESA